MTGVELIAIALVATVIILLMAGYPAALTLGGVVTVWEVYLLTGLRGTVLVLDAPARQALTYQMVGRDELPNAVALNSSLFNAARVVGPQLHRAAQDVEELVLVVVVVQRDRALGARAVERHHRLFDHAPWREDSFHGAERGVAFGQPGIDVGHEPFERTTSPNAAAHRMMELRLTGE